jgi:hypothetical protein
MKSAMVIKIVGCAAFGFFLGSCTRTLIDQESRAPQTLGCTEATHELGTSQDLSAFLEEISQVLVSYEDQLALHEGSRIGILSKLPRLCFILGELGEEQAREKQFEKGRYYAELLCQEQPGRVEGHYWLALNLGGLAESGGAGRGLRLVPAIVEELQAALAIDEDYDQAGPHRVLGRVRYAAPSWPLSEGDLNDSLQHLRTAVQIAPGNSTNHLFLAETLIRLGKDQEAIRELQQVVVCQQHAVWSHALEDDHRAALRLMMRYESARGERQDLESKKILALPGKVP